MKLNEKEKQFFSDAKEQFSPHIEFFNKHMLGITAIVFIVICILLW